jgi:hypothetical protein
VAKLPQPPEIYSKSDQQNVRSTLDQRDDATVKQGGTYEVKTGRVILQSPDGTRWYLTVDNAGAPGFTAV